MSMTKVEKMRRVDAVMRRLSAQFPDMPEARLCCAIVRQAARDLVEGQHRCSAEEYLRHAWHAELCGVDPDWVRSSFEKAGLLQPRGDRRSKLDELTRQAQELDMGY